MSIDSLKNEQRLDELLIDQAIGGLDAGQQAELRALLADDSDHFRNPYMETAALVQLGMATIEQSRGSGPGGLPPALRARLAASAAGLTPGRDAQPAAAVNTAESKAESANVIDMAARRQASAAGTVGSRMSYMGWAVAAALAVAFFIVGGTPASGDAERLTRSQLLAETGTIVIPWAGAETGYEQVSGDVIWNDELQQGYMRLAGLPANDPARAQYQLWIVDPERSPQPVDGGVFDVTAGGDAIIPVTAKLAVSEPAAFAITLEQPGGVVVSAGPLLVVAAGS